MNTKKIQHKGHVLFIVIALLIMAMCFTFSHSKVAVAYAQDTPTPTPTPDAEKDRLQREADIATLKQTKAVADQKTAEARKAKLEAKFPKPTTSPLAGTTTISDGAVIESQIVSYVSMAKAAEKIIAGINTHKGDFQNLAVYNERDINLFLSYKVANNQVASIQDHYCKVLAPTATTVPPCPPPSPTPTPSPGAKLAGPEVLSIPESFLGAFVDFT